jgi:transposase
MMGRAQHRQSKLFYTRVNLDERMPEDHPLRRVDRVVDFSFVRREVAHCYGGNGNESIDPTVILKLLFLAFFENVRSERELMRQLPLRLDWLWFCELDLDDEAPHHSVLSKARARWGLGVFERIFEHVLQQCATAGLVDGTTAYADSTVLKANASVDSRIPRKLWEQLEREQASAPERRDAEDGGEGDDAGGRSSPDHVPRATSPEDTQSDELPSPPRGKFNRRHVSRTDPEAATTSRRGRDVKLGYRDHCLVDGTCGVVTATIATAADYDDAALLVPLLNKHEQYLGSSPRRAVADSLYGTKQNIERMRWRGVRPYLKRRASKNDRRHWLDRLPEECDRATAIALMNRRLHMAEGRFAQAHVRHDHRRCRWRRRWRVQIQCYLVATVQNIGKLAKYARRARGRVALAMQRPCEFALPAVGVLIRAAFGAVPRRCEDEPLLSCPAR